jgi:hypothetical protein
MKRMALATAALLLAGCEINVKGDAGADANVAGGEVSLKAPGIGLNVNLPDALKAEISGDNNLVFPGASVSGLNINAGAGPGQGGNSVRLSFTTPAAVEEVLAWYRDPARAIAFNGVSVQRDGAGYRITGNNADGGDPFSVRLAPGNGGGTSAQLELQNAG